MIDFDNQLELQKRYQITSEERERFLKEVIAYFTTGKNSTNEPTFFFASGQPGCGKTQLVKKINLEQNGNAVIYTFDEVRALHPRFEQANRELNGDVHAALFPDTDLAINKIEEYCRNHKLSAVRESTMRRKDDIIETAYFFKQAGYRIEGRLMAVPKMESYESMVHRYAMQLENDEPARWITQEVHDVTYDKIVDTVRYVTDNNLLDRMVIYRRGDISKGELPVEIYSTEGKQFANPVEALEYGRTHDLKHHTPAFLSEIKKTVDIITKKAPAHIKDLDYLKDFYSANVGEIECK